MAAEERPFSLDGIAYDLKLYTNPLYVRAVGESGYPMDLKSGQQLDAAIQISEASPELRVMAKRCWVSTEESQENGKQKTLFTNGCPVDPFLLLAEQSEAFNGYHQQRFSFVAERYEPDSGLYYLHCLIKLCSLTGQHSSNLLPTCSRDSVCSASDEDSNSGGISFLHKTVHKFLGPLLVRRRKPGSDASGSEMVTDRKGMATDSDGQDPECSRGNNPPPLVQQVIGLDMNLVVGIAFASFFVGALLVVTLWSIHTCTKRKQRQRQSLSTDTASPLSQNGGTSIRTRAPKGKPWPVNL